MPICCMLAYVVATMLEMYICMWGSAFGGSRIGGGSPPWWNGCAGGG